MPLLLVVIGLVLLGHPIAAAWVAIGGAVVSLSIVAIAAIITALK